MRRRIAILLTLSLTVPPAMLLGQQATAPQPPIFRAGVNLVIVDVVVRDQSGAIVKGLKADDFELDEDGVKQQILTFAYDEVRADAAPIETGSTLAAAGSNRRTAATAVAAPPAPEPTHPLTSEEVAGHRLITLLFDTNSMEPDDVQKAIDGATTWVRERMTTADLVAVAAVGSSLQVLTDFTTSKEHVEAVLSSLSAASGTAFAAVDTSTAATDDAAQTATDDSTAVDASAQELDTFNNDVRLRAIKTLAEALKPIEQKKAILYFSAGMQRSGTDNQVELRAVVDAAVRANVVIYPVDARGLQAVVPGGSARQASRGGLAAFSGSAVASQFNQLAAQQETLTSLASDTGGTAFTDTNDFGDAFTKIERDISSYYILGFASTNGSRDGRYRRLTVRVKNHPRAKIDAKKGYYADRDFAHTARTDREALLLEQLATPLPATDVPVFVTAGWFRVAADKYYVPIAVALPGSAVPDAKENATLDIAGFIRDERGMPIARIRDTLNLKNATEGVAQRQILYQTGATLPPGRFTVKVVVRENADGRMGSFEAPVAVPELKQAPVKVSSLVLGTQLRHIDGAKAANPIVRDGIEIVPNVTHIVGRDQKVYFYYEVYEPKAENGAPRLETSLTFYRGKVKVLETPITERTQIDAADRRAEVFRLELPAGSLTPGLYTCQVNIIDQVAGAFAFPRLQMYVR